MLTPLVRRTFAPRGQTPVQKCWDRHDRISAISALTLSPERHRLGLYFSLLPENTNVRSEDIIDFLRLLRRQIQRPLEVIWDRINIHDNSRQVRRYLARNRHLRTHRLPAYAPELNPDEGVWNHIKLARLANFAAVDVHDLRNTVHSELEGLRTRKNLLASFVRHSGLPLSVGDIY
jgi:transposase